MVTMGRYMIGRMLMRLMLAAACAAPAVLAAADYPARPIRLVIPFPPGGGSDTLARILAPRMSEAMGQQWVVDNRAGAAGNIASSVVANSGPDGYTVLLTLNSVLTVNPALYPKLKLDPLKDLQPITQLSLGQYIVVLHPSVAASSISEFLELARAKPGTLRYASSGVGSNPHLAGELLNSMAKINLLHVPYKGAGPSTVAVLSGEVQVAFQSVAAAQPHVRAGKVRAIAVTGLERSTVFPELPTLDEAGLTGYNIISWHALLAPAKTPAAIVDTLYDTVRRVVQEPEVASAMGRQGMESAAKGPAELEKLIRSESAALAKVIKAANIRIE